MQAGFKSCRLLMLLFFNRVHVVFGDNFDCFNSRYFHDLDILSVVVALTFEQEIDFLLIHGILHLLGFNHENTSKEEANEMRKKEKELFNKINCRNKVSI